MVSKTKIGIVGTGRMGSLHLSKFQSLPMVDLVGIYEPSQERARELSESSSIKAFSSIEELIFSVDGLVIASPTPTHFSIAKMALKQGCHVLIEKPFCESIEEAIELERLAQSQELVCQIGFLERFRLEALMGPYSVPRQSTIQSQRLSTVVGREAAVDVVSDLMIHDVDLVLSIAKEEPTSVSATGFSIVTDYVDFATARLEFSCGLVADLIASRVSSVQKRTLQIISEGYTCELDFISNSKFSSAKADRDKHLTKPIVFDALAAQSINFVESINGKASPKIDAKQGARVIATIEKIRNAILGAGSNILFPTVIDTPVLTREN